MKLLTINLHSYLEKEWQRKLNIFTDYIFENLPDVIAMQEVNQSLSYVPAGYIKNCIDVGNNIPPAKDNYGLILQERLKEKCCDYHYIWCGIKESYGRFHEGLGFFVKNEPLRVTNILLSKTDKNDNWKKRMALGVKCNGIWFYNLHMGRWDDREEPFKFQWKNLINNISAGQKTVLMGDFNAPADSVGESYDMILADGWKDTWRMAQNKDEGFTVKGNIDGWQDKENEVFTKRIDYIFTNYNCDVFSSHTVFNGKSQDTISDHYGIEVNLEG